MSASSKPELDDQAELLAERFEKGIKDGFGAVLIMYSVNKRDEASSKEIRKDIESIFKGGMSYNYTSFYRLINRLRDEFELIIEKNRKKGKGPDRVYYGLTPLGRRVLKIIFNRYMKPLATLSAQEQHFV